jgi:DNA-binding IscR family transcriptional regulator
MIATSVGTSGSVIRRILSDLCSAGLISGSAGRHGGYRLAKSPSKISLRDIFVAVETEEMFPSPSRAPSDVCPVGSKIQDALALPMKMARSDIERSLAKTILQDLMRTFRQS